MVMVPYDYARFIRTMQGAVASGAIPPARVDDAVRRILGVKFRLGLFDRPADPPDLAASVRSPEHLALAREAVAKSVVLLKNDGAALPLAQDLPVLFVAGTLADDIGAQSGGWTLEWQGRTGNVNPGTSILAGLRQAATTTRVEYVADGRFDAMTGADGQPLIAEAAVVVLGETPYAEGVGDRSDLTLPFGDIALLERVRKQARRVIVVLISGRPLVITRQLPLMDALVAAWLPGTEGAGVADVLFGGQPFTGRLPYTWPRRSDQLPLNINNLGSRTGCEGPLFPLGYGLVAGEVAPALPECP
jgi:beta-glucosidase